jgi:predicted RNase H-like HicB family nuclease
MPGILIRFSALVQLDDDGILEPVEIQFTSQIFRDGKMYVAYTPELDVSSRATTKAKAQKNLLEAVQLFLEEAEKKDSLQQILKTAGCVRRKQPQLKVRY